jgi:anti-sigma factor RsiW
MKCERIENLLPAFVEGDLAPVDESAVHAHLADCERCRESLAAYRALEDALVMRRDEVPPADAFLRGVFAPAVSTNLHRARTLMDALFSFPALASFACLVVGWLAFAYSDVVTRSLNWLVGESSLLGRFGHWTTASLTTLTGGDMIVIVAAYTIVTLLILGSGALMTLHYVHSD